MPVEGYVSLRAPADWASCGALAGDDIRIGGQHVGVAPTLGEMWVFSQWVHQPSYGVIVLAAERTACGALAPVREETMFSELQDVLTPAEIDRLRALAAGADSPMGARRSELEVRNNL